MLNEKICVKKKKKKRNTTSTYQVVGTVARTRTKPTSMHAITETAPPERVHIVYGKRHAVVSGIRLTERRRAEIGLRDA